MTITYVYDTCADKEIKTDTLGHAKKCTHNLYVTIVIIRRRPMNIEYTVFETFENAINTSILFSVLRSNGFLERVLFEETKLGTASFENKRTKKIERILFFEEFQ